MNQDGRQNGCSLSVCTCLHSKISILVIYLLILPHFIQGLLSSNSLPRSTVGFVWWRINKLASKMTIPSSLQGIMPGSLLESDSPRDMKFCKKILNSRLRSSLWGMSHPLHFIKPYHLRNYPENLGLFDILMLFLKVFFLRKFIGRKKSAEDNKSIKFTQQAKS